MLTYQFKPEATNTLALYDFANSTRDISGNGNDGTLHGSTQFDVTPPIKYKSPIYFASSTKGLTGTVGYMSFPTSIMNTAGGTVEFIFRTSADVSSSQSIFRVDGPGAGSRDLEVNIYNSFMSFLLDGGNYNIYNTGLTLVANKQYYCAMSWNGTNLTRCYVGLINDDGTLTVAEVGGGMAYSPDFSAITVVQVIRSQNTISNFTGEVTWLRLSDNYKTSFPTQDINNYNIQGVVV